MTCEQALEAARLEIEALRNDVAIEQKDHLRTKRSNQALKRALAEHHADDPGSKIVGELLETWQIETGHHRCDVRIDGKRADRVRWALKSRDPDYVRQIFKAAGRFPYVWGGRRQMYGTSDQRYDDVTTLLKDERTMERMFALLEAPVERTVNVPQSALDAMRRRVEMAQWAEKLWRDQVQNEHDLNAALMERLAEFEAGRPRLSVVA